ncbi:transposable element Tcb2 transposase [Trichonephila clavipes]|nr:transposable element Tcb2 transposase [Trichonephila clavipes]
MGAVDTRWYPRTENRVWSDQEDHEERGSKDRAASTCGPHSDSFNDTSRLMNPGLFWGQMITVYGCGGALTLPWPARSPDFSQVEHVWYQLKRQMPSCHSVYDLEVAVQDLWAHLPQDNIRCVINSMPDRMAACIAAGGGPTRY